MNSGTQNSRTKLILVAALLAAAGFLCVNTFLPGFVAEAQTVSIPAEPTGIRIGERLTYNISVGRFPNTAYAELYAVSRGRITDKDAIELRSKFKTLDLASATVYLVDETRTTFASPASGLPLHIAITQNTFGLPKETNISFLTAPTTHFDIATMIYRIRQSGGNGSLTLLENERVYPVTFQ